MLKKLRTPLLHALVWLAIVSLLRPPENITIDNRLYIKTDFFPNKWFIFYNVGCIIAFFYANFYWFIPKFYLQKRLKTYIVFCTGTLLFTVSSAILLHYFLGGSFNEMPWKHTFMRIVIMFFIVTMVSLALRLNKEWKRADEERTKSEKERLAAELSYLKAQINPHFLFNTLNSIYALAVTKSDNAPEAVVKLSRMMRYVITDANQDWVSLDKELAYINDFISLQKIRLSDNNDVRFSISGSPIGYQIAPLILISFIENAFKYGISTKQATFTDISLSIEDGYLRLYVKNDKFPHKQHLEEGAGIGIDNSVKRLDLIYPEQYTLERRDLDNTYEIDLKIRLV